MRTRLLALALTSVLVACGGKDKPSAPTPPTEQPPQISDLAVTPSVAARGKQVDIRFTVSRAVAKVDAHIGALEAACATPDGNQITCSYTTQGNEPEGPQDVQVHVVDSGNLEAQALGTVTFDFTAPVVLIGNAPPKLSNLKTFTLDIQPSETSTLTCAIDHEQPVACTSPKTLAGLGEGQHTFAVVATDAAGNQGFATIDFTLDYKAPDTSIDTPPPALSNSNDVQVGFTASESPVTFECRLDNDPFKTCPTPYTFQSVGEGAHTLEARAVDPAGNPDPTPAKVSFKLDRTAPKTTVMQPADTGKPDRTITFSANEPGVFHCSVDGAQATSCTSPASLTGLADGVHTFDVRATDNAGNTEEPPVQVGFVVDTTPPQAQFTSTPPQQATSASATFAFNSTEPQSLFECRLDAQLFAPCTSPFALTLTTDGRHSFEVRATDHYGNQQATATKYEWETDAFAPVLTLSGAPPALTKSTSASLSFSANKTATFTCAVDQGAPVPCSSPLDLTGLTEGPHSVEVVATSVGGRASQPATANWTVDLTAPTASFQRSPPALGNAATAHFEFSSSEPNSTFTCSLDGATPTTCTSPADLAVNSGPHTFAVVARDPAGNDSAAVTVSFETDTLAPSVPSADQPDPSVVVNTTPTLSWGAVADADSYTAELATTPDFSQVAQSKTKTTDLFLVPSPLAARRYYFHVKASDKAGNDSAWSAPVVIEIRAWDFLNPQPQGATITAVDCTSATACWFVGEAGLAMRTTDGGATFKLASTGVSGALNALHVFDGTTAVAVGAGGAVVRTTDGGVTWFAVASGVTADLYGMRFNGTTGLAVGDAGTVVKSTDKGLTWTKLKSAGTASLRDVELLDATATNAVAAGGTGTLVKTTDGGTTWTTTTKGTSKFNALQFVDANTGFALGDSGSMAKTTDGGLTWGTVNTDNAPKNTNTQDLFGLSFSDANTGFTLGGSTSSLSALRRTTDGGVTWTNVGLSNNVPLRSMKVVAGTQAVWVAGTAGQILVSSDGGTSFALASGVSGGPVSSSNQDLRALQFVSTNVGFVVGGSGYAKRTDDGGKTFTSLTGFSATAGLWAVSMLDDKTGWIGGDNNVVARTTDGVAFTTVSAGTINVRGMHFKTTDIGVVVGTNGKIKRWDSTSSTFLDEQGFEGGVAMTNSWRAVMLTSASDGFVVGDSGKIAIYDATNKRWNAESSGVSVQLTGVWAFDAQTAVAVGDLGKILRRTSAGWTSVISGTTQGLKSVAFADALHGWAVGNGVILATTDGGQTWSPQSTPTGETLQAVSAPSASTVYAAGDFRNLLKTTVGGF